MSQPDGRADQSQKTTTATKTTKPGAKKASKGGKSWFASIILTLVGVAVVTYLARSGGDTPPPVVSGNEEPELTVNEEPKLPVDEEWIIVPEPDEEEPNPKPKVAAATGALLITSGVQGADVFLNGKRVGTTPHKATPLIVGHYQVEVVKAGYETFKKNVEVTATSQTLRADLKRIAAVFRVESNVLGATVALDGQARGTTPVEIADLTPGTYELVVRAEGYETHSKTVNYAGGARDIRVELELATIVLNEAVAVKHKHRLGGCDGVLRASAEGIRFETDHKDAFFVSFSKLERIRFDKDKLNLKIQGGRKYNFVEQNTDEDALVQFYERVDETLAQMVEANQKEP